MTIIVSWSSRHLPLAMSTVKLVFRVHHCWQARMVSQNWSPLSGGSHVSKGRGVRDGRKGFRQRQLKCERANVVS